MATEKFREAGYYANLINCDPTLIERERLLADVQLRDTSKEDLTEQTCDSEYGTFSDRLHKVKNLIQGNIDALDYLRGISSLEKSFSNLIEEVIRTAVVLSEVNSVSYPQHVYDPSMEEKVDRCWTYIRQLTDVVHWHVTQAIRYHKFYHDIKTSQFELVQFVQRTVDSMRELETLDLNDLCQLERVNEAIQEQIVKFPKLASTIQQLVIQARTVAPLQYRHLLPAGRHSAEILASMRLPDGTWLHRGDSVKAWVSNTMASELHHEWQMETLSGNQTATLPSLCLWLTSPSSSPESSLRDPITSEVMTDVRHTRSSKQPSINQAVGETTPKRFTSAKAFAHMLQNDLLNHWMEMINEYARLLLPVYAKYLAFLMNTKGDINVANVEEIRTFFEKLKPLLQYGDSDELPLLEDVSRKNYRVSKQDPSVDERKFQQLSTTLQLWNQLRDLLKEAKKTASLRSFDKSTLEQSPRRYLDTGVRTFDSRRAITPSTDPIDLTHEQPLKSVCGDSSQNEELITSFAEPAPKTFRIAPKKTIEKLDSNELEEITTMRSPSIAQRSDRAKRAQSHPVDSRELMTQVTTPYIPTLINCPRCALPYEVEIYSSDIDLNNLSRTQLHDSPSVSSGRLMVYASDQTPIQSDHSLLTPADARITGSSPTLVRPTNRSSSTTRIVEPSAKPKKKRSRFGRHRSHSLTINATETTGSSGFGSSPERTSTITKRGLKKRIALKKHHEDDGVKKAKVPFFHWGKRTRQKTIEPPTFLSNQAETTTGDASRHYERNVTQPILRSRSWAQQGTPWGYGPPLHDQWHPTSQYVSPKESYSIRSPQMQSHSEKLVTRASRPRLFGERLSASGAAGRLGTPHPFNTMDSGIQTDTDVTAGQSDVFAFDSPPTMSQASRIEEIREKNQAGKLSPYMLDYVMQSSPQYSPLDPRAQQAVRVESSCQTSEKSTEQWQNGSQAQTWDVCCQIGVLYQNKSIFAHVKEQEKRIPKENICVAEVQTEGKAPISMDYVGSSEWKKQPRCSVSCQIGSVVVNTGVGSDIIEAVQLLDENIRVYEQNEFTRDKDGKSRQPDTLLVGKKLQVGSPWWQEELEIGPRITVSDIGLSPIEELQSCEGEIFRKSQNMTDAWTQTLNADDHFDHKSEYVGKLVQTQLAQVSDRIPVGARAKSYPVDNAECITKTQHDLLESAATTPSGVCYVSTGSDALWLQPTRSVDVQVLRPSQLSASTQIGLGFSPSDLDDKPLHEVKQKAAAPLGQLSFANKDSPHEHDAISVPITSQLSVDTKLLTPELTGTTPIQTQCSKCGHTFEMLRQTQTRSKRIQKGSPTFMQASPIKRQSARADGDQSTSEMEIIDDSNTELDGHTFVDKTTTTRSSRAYQMPRRKVPHLVFDVGLCSGKHGSSRRHVFTRRGFSQPAPDFWHDDYDEGGEFNDSTTSSDCDERKEPFGSVRMCFHLSPSPRTNCGSRWNPVNRQRHKVKPTWLRSLSVDDLPSMGQCATGRLMEKEVHSSYVFDQKRQQPERRRVAYVDGVSNGARRRIDRIRQRPDLY